MLLRKRVWGRARITEAVRRGTHDTGSAPRLPLSWGQMVPWPGAAYAAAWRVAHVRLWNVMLRVALFDLMSRMAYCSLFFLPLLVVFYRSHWGCRQSSVCVCVCVCACVCVCGCVCVCVCVYMYVCVREQNTHMHIRTHIYVRAHLRVCAHTRTNAHTCVHILMQLGCLHIYQSAPG